MFHRKERRVKGLRLAGNTLCGNLRAMSTLSALPVDPKELRPLLHAEVDKLNDDNLLVLH